MKVFVTGASGFVGSAVVKELIRTGHQVLGLARSEESATAIRNAGAEVLMGSLEDYEMLKQGVLESDGVIHTGFIHDFARFARSNEIEKEVIHAMGEALAGTSKPIVVTAGILGLPPVNGMVTEESMLQIPLRTSESAALKLAENGVHVSVVRLAPSTHDQGDKGFVPFIIHQARKHGVAAYPGDGSNRWPAVHRQDAAKLFCLALEKGAKGALYNAIGDTGIEMKKIAELIGEKLNVPLKSLSAEETARHFEWMSHFIAFDSPATSFKTQELLGWKPTGIGLLEDMTKHYF
ncbi:SDR family oxidoreductase [Fluviicola sp.]|uniref:SDR family oxidoreductase n=1 Tax=Fluviicola sp. TaxID=1917219 RepID=UPI00261B3F2C|nr:SDR family oxidoreductase [Fluviicola sp.]